MALVGPEVLAAEDMVVQAELEEPGELAEDVAAPVEPVVAERAEPAGAAAPAAAAAVAERVAPAVAAAATATPS